MDYWKGNTHFDGGALVAGGKIKEVGAEEAEPPQFVVTPGSMKRLRRAMKKRLEEDRAEPIGSDANPDEDRPY